MAVSSESSIDPNSSTHTGDAFKPHFETSVKKEMFSEPGVLPANTHVRKRPQCALGEKLKADNEQNCTNAEQTTITEDVLAENTNQKVFSKPEEFNQELWPGREKLVVKLRENTEAKHFQHETHANFNTTDLLVSEQENGAIDLSKVNVVVEHKLQKSLNGNSEAKHFEDEHVTDSLVLEQEGKTIDPTDRVPVLESKRVNGISETKHFEDEHMKIKTVPVNSNDTAPLSSGPKSEPMGAGSASLVSEPQSDETLVVIINIKDFFQYTMVEHAIRKKCGMLVPRLDIQNRDGSDVDVDRLSHMLKCFEGFDVFAYDNLSSSSTRNLLKDIGRGLMKRGKHQDMRSYDRFLLFILTHGERGWLYGVESFAISISEVVEMFSAENCPPLANKPKVVFPVACRNGTLLPEDYFTYFNLKKRMMLENNLMVIYPTQFGCKSYRCPIRGTLFVYQLLKALQDCHQERDLLGIMEIVSNKLRQDEKYSQHPEYMGHLENEFYFKLMDGCRLEDITLDGMENAGTVGKTQSE